MAFKQLFYESSALAFIVCSSGNSGAIFNLLSGLESQEAIAASLEEKFSGRVELAEDQAVS